MTRRKDLYGAPKGAPLQNAWQMPFSAASSAVPFSQPGTRALAHEEEFTGAKALTFCLTRFGTTKVRIMHFTQGRICAIVVYVIEASHLRPPVLSGASLRRGRSSDERDAARLLRPSSPLGASSTSCVAR